MAKSSRPTKTEPSWQVLFLVAHHLDPHTLATSSCVSKSWASCFTLDHHWKPMCTANYPSLSTLKTTHPQLPYRRLYSLGRASEKRRLQNPLKPRLSLQNLAFSITVASINCNNNDGLVAAAGDDVITCGSNGLFKFDIKTRPGSGNSVSGRNDVVKVCWNVALKNWGGVFCMMECEGKADGWFSGELPATGCCGRAIGSGLMAELKLGFCDENGVVRVEKVSVGLLGVGSWRYVSVDDGLRYLQHFLLDTVVV